MKTFQAIGIRHFEGAIALLLTLFGIAACSTVASPSSTSNPVSARNTPNAVGSAVELSALKAKITLPPGTAIAGRIVRTIVVDGGDLVIEPANPRQVPQISSTSAEAVIAAASTSLGSAIGKPVLLGYGRIKIAPALRSGLSPSFENRLVWVALVPQELGAFCPPSASPSSPQAFSVIIASADSKAAFALTYRSRGSGACGGSIRQPSISPSIEIRSLRWIALGQATDPHQPGFVDWSVSYTIPGCGSLFDKGVRFIGPSHDVLAIDAITPVYPPASCAPARQITTSVGPESVPIAGVAHSLVGVGIQ